MGTRSRGRITAGPGPRRAIVSWLAASGSPYSKRLDQRRGRMPRNRAKRFELSDRVKALRYAILLDDFRLAQHVRMGTCRVSGLWLRNVGDRHQTKRQIQQTIRQILPRFPSVQVVGKFALPGTAPARPAFPLWDGHPRSPPVASKSVPEPRMRIKPGLCISSDQRGRWSPQWSLTPPHCGASAGINNTEAK